MNKQMYYVPNFMRGRGDYLNYLENVLIPYSIPKEEFKVERTIFNDPATIVFWDKEDKTVVKATDGDTYSPEFGFLIAYFEKNSGMSRTQVNKFMKKLRKDYEEQMAAKDKN